MSPPGTDSYALLDALINPPHLWSAAEILDRPSPLPREKGVYAWYFREIPPQVPTTGCIVQFGLTLLYVGISPAAPPTNGRPPSKQNLYHRIHYHYTGNAAGSTLRLTLGVLLSPTLGIRLQRVGSASRCTFAEGERLLSQWMAANALITWTTSDEPWRLEHSAFRMLVLPLNLRDNDNSSFRNDLSRLRIAARNRALGRIGIDRGE